MSDTASTPATGSERTQAALLLPPPSPHGPLTRLARVGALVAVLGGAVALEIPLCPFAILTRHPCPGCGLTRAALALMRGDAAEALHLHPLSVVLVPVIGLVLAHNALSYVKDGRVAATESLQGRRPTVIAIVLGALGLIVWIARFFGAFGGPVPV